MMSFFNYKKGSEKWYMEREGFFYYENHMKCAGVIHFTLHLDKTNQNQCYLVLKINFEMLSP